MIRGIGIFACLVASSCGSADTTATNADNKVSAIGTPAAVRVAPTEAYCLKEGDKPDSGFSNTKECLMVACDAGDEPSCRMMETYNGSLEPVPEATEQGTS